MSVQGVGFRPHVHRVASELELSGLVRNDAAGVVIEIEGDAQQVRAFPDRLLAGAPPLAAVEHLVSRSIPPRDTHHFVIEDSEPGGRCQTLVSPDVATCDACFAEVTDPTNRRYRYPFTNCTDCGPRFTILNDVPYDRRTTTMASFEMCDACRHEYDDPGSRRFHAEPIACNECGPSLWFADADNSLRGPAAMAKAVAVLTSGGTVALKGLGGYHLACDATSEEAVQRLRHRKRREAKPLAIMVKDEAGVRRIASADSVAMQLVTSRERPIVLLSKNADQSVANAVAPGSRHLGVMLPYTPLHLLLLEAVGKPLVMTSGNLTDEPIAFIDDDARLRLDGVADAFLGHDRPIETRCDDSVVRIIADAPSFVRRSRGYAPKPISLSTNSSVSVLAVGGHLKNTFCLAMGRHAFLSHHVGDLENASAVQGLRDGVAHYCRLFDIVPEMIAHDLHPDYATARLVDEFGDLDTVPVQHHHAHVASVIAEHGLQGPVLGVAFDGAGLGTDGAVWGGEFLLVEGARFERLAHLAYVPLPGGDKAAREPWRMAAAHVRASYGSLDAAPIPIAGGTRKALSVLSQMMERGINSPPTSSVGRLFDAVAALIGVRQKSQFEAQAAMELETLADPSCSRTYEWDLTESGSGHVLDAAPMIRGVIDDVHAGCSPGEIAGAFHNALADMIHETLRVLKLRTGVSTVVLTGGVFQNAILTEHAIRRLVASGFDVHIQRLVPCNDGGLSLGQAYVARCHHGES